MRIGVNPEKEKNSLEIDSYHRVIIPIYIPNLVDDYFKDGLEILKLSLESLLETIHQKTKITLINNNSCKEVVSYIEALYLQNESIDQLLNSKINLGKVNALYSAIKSNLEPIITVSDSDVMFLSSWQQEVETVIQQFPSAGMVSPVPSSRGYNSAFLNSTTYFSLFGGKLKFSDVKHKDGMIKFEESIGRKMYNEAHLDKYLTITKNETKAVIGCGHFVATFRASVFENAPETVCQHKIVGGSESDYLDEPNDKGGFLRLSTHGNYAYHLGNKKENWMDEKLLDIKSNTTEKKILTSIPDPEPLGKLKFYLGLFLHKLLFKKFKKQFFKFKGMKSNF